MITKIQQKIIDCFKRGNKVLICGNGGSAAMSSHMAGEFIGKFEHDREPLPAIALTTDSSIITAIANDLGYENIFARQIEALGKPGDILIIFTTSKVFTPDHSWNIGMANLQANTAEGNMGMEVIYAPREGDSTAHIQEYQLKWMHDVCREVELAFIEKK